MSQLDARKTFQIKANEMRVRTETRIAHGHGLRVGLGMSDELGKCFGREIFAHDEKIRRTGEHSHRHEIARVVSDLFVKRETGAETAQIAGQQRVPISGAFATRAEPIVPPAPAAFSTIIG